jgi:hypothetical protein
MNGHVVDCSYSYLKAGEEWKRAALAAEAVVSGLSIMTEPFHAHAAIQLSHWTRHHLF